MADRKAGLTDEQQRRVVAVERLQEYLDTYDTQHEYENYTDETYINDILYGLGVSIDNTEYKYHSGYVKFLQRLQEHITTALENASPRDLKPIDPMDEALREAVVDSLDDLWPDE